MPPQQAPPPDPPGAAAPLPWLPVGLADMPALFGPCPVGSVRVGIDGRVQDANDAFLDMLGAARAELLAGRLCWPDPALPGWIAAAAPACPPHAIAADRPDGVRRLLVFPALCDRGTGTAAALVVDPGGAAAPPVPSWLRRLVEDMPVAVAAFDADMRYLAVSADYVADYRLAPATPASLLGRGHYEVFPEIPQRWRDVHRRALAGETLECEEDAFPRRDGRTDWLQWRMAPWRHPDGRIGGAILVSTFVTARRQAEEALRVSETRLRLAAEAAGIGIHDVDLATGQANWSAELFALFGIAPTPDGRADTAMWRERVHPDDLAAADAAWRRSVELGEPYHTVYRIRRAGDGAERWMEGYGRPDASPRGAGRMLGVILDITERKRAEAILRDANAELERRVAERTRALTDAGRELQAEMRRREEAQASLLQTQKLEALGQLTGGVAHDFNNVLAAILGSFELLANRVADERLRRFVAIGERAARRAETLVRQLLAFARREQADAGAYRAGPPARRTPSR